MRALPDPLRRFGALLRADLLERARSLRFWIALLVIAAASAWIFPARDAGYLTLAVAGPHRGAYSSAWIGMVCAQFAAAFLGLIGFYLVRGTLARDIETRVWQLLCATPMTRAGYLFAKAASHLVVMGLAAGAVLAVGLVVQRVRAEDPHVDLVELVKPMLLLAAPSFALTAMGAVWFDLVPWLRRTGGNVAWFFLWMLMLSSFVEREMPQKDHPQPAAVSALVCDPAGLGLFVRALERRHLPALGGDHFDGISLGRASFGGKAIETFDWPRWDPTPRDLVTPLAWLAVAGVGVALASLVLDRFAARASATPGRARDASGRSLRWLARALRPLERGPVGVLLAAEVQLVLRQRRAWWWLLLLGCLGAQAFGSAHAVALGVLFAWLLLLDVLSGAALRDVETRTTGFVFTAPAVDRRVLLARAGSGALLVIVATAPALMRTAVFAPVTSATALAMGASLVAWGFALGAWTRTTRVFEMGVVALAYVTLNGATILSIDAPFATVGAWHLAGLPIAALLAVTGWRRARQRSSVWMPWAGMFMRASSPSTKKR